MPLEDLGLHQLAFAQRIEAKFPKDDRFIFREVLQTREIAFEISASLQINVEGQEIDV